jgi:hypothetical protein
MSTLLKNPPYSKKVGMFDFLKKVTQPLMEKVVKPVVQTVQQAASLLPKFVQNVTQAFTQPIVQAVQTISQSLRPVPSRPADRTPGSKLPSQTIPVFAPPPLPVSTPDAPGIMGPNGLVYDFGNTPRTNVPAGDPSAGDWLFVSLPDTSDAIEWFR